MARPKKDPALKASGSTSGQPVKRRARVDRPAALKWKPSFKLSATGQALFRHLSPHVREIGYVRETDLPAFTRYVEMLGMWHEAALVLRPVEEGGDGKYIDTPMTNGDAVMKRLHPAFNVLTRLGTQLESIEAQFGFTPASRYSILARLASDPASGGRQAPQPDGEQASFDIAPSGSAVDYFIPASAPSPGQKLN